MVDVDSPAPSGLAPTQTQVTPVAARTGTRYETKFLLARWRVDAFASWLDATCRRDPDHPTGHVRTVYFDTLGSRFLQQKVNSDYLKAKVRLRWYAAATSERGKGSAWLEIKFKEGARGGKLRFEAEGWASQLDQLAPSAIDIESLLAAARREGIRLPAVSASLALGYTRQRWVEASSGTRIAVDSAIRPTWARRARIRIAGAMELRQAVVEFKGPARGIPPLLHRAARFGLRQASFSKYYECFSMVDGV